MKLVLSPEQALAAENRAGYTSITATAGAGKTTTISYRIAGLLEMLGKDREHEVLATTFTREAARELQDRIEKFRGRKTNNRFGTLHSFCHNEISAHHGLLGYDSRPVILDEKESRERLLEVACYVTQQKSKEDFTKNICSEEVLLNWRQEIDTRTYMENNPLDYNPYLSERVIPILSSIYREFQKRFLEEGVIDYDALLTEYLRLLKMMNKRELFNASGFHPDLPQLKILAAQKVSDSYYQNYAKSLPRFLFVDEAQDLSAIQWGIVQEISHSNKTLYGSEFMTVVIGDDDQSLYSWRGARVWRFRKYVQRAGNSFFLSTNRRCAKNIVDLGAQIVETIPPERRIEKSLLAHNVHPGDVQIFIAKEHPEHLRQHASNILRGVQSGASKFSDFAFIYRGKKDIKEGIEGILASLAIPYRVLADRDSMDMPELKVIKYWGALVMPSSQENLVASGHLRPENLFHWQKFLTAVGVSADAALRSMDEAKKTGGSLGDVRAALLRSKISSDVKNMVLSQLGSLEVLRRDALIGLSFGAFRKHASTSGFTERSTMLKSRRTFQAKFKGASFDSADGRRILESNTKRFQSFVGHFDDSSLVKGLGDLVLEKKDDTDAVDAVSLTSAHSSKGLEWKTVFVVNFHDGHWPSPMRSKGSKKGLNDREKKAFEEGMDEEKRLLYVAITRAKENLYFIMPVNTRSVGGNSFGFGGKPAEIEDTEPTRLMVPHMRRWMLGLLSAASSAKESFLRAAITAEVITPPKADSAQSKNTSS